MLRSHALGANRGRYTDHRAHPEEGRRKALHPTLSRHSDGRSRPFDYGLRHLNIAANSPAIAPIVPMTITNTLTLRCSPDSDSTLVPNSFD